MKLIAVMMLAFVYPPHLLERQELVCCPRCHGKRGFDAGPYNECQKCKGYGWYGIVGGSWVRADRSYICYWCGTIRCTHQKEFNYETRTRMPRVP